MQRPAWQEHITVVRDEEPPDERKHLWETRGGELVEFEYNTIPRTNGHYWWLDVVSPCLLSLREELGLARDPVYPLHLSFGHEKEI